MQKNYKRPCFDQISGIGCKPLVLKSYSYFL
jgi:hypothetical protein